eukprot:GHVQ01030002.1.p1 GENE.GHVQ01030002.1~~GHVQ01030002.1.p1  ORF type:complete len:100 (+),score=6.97 GHVQ01030002.1:756-1055(+)
MLYIKLKKSQLAQSEIEMLGHRVSIRGIEASTHKVEALVQAQTPKDKAELRSFLGLESYLRRFVPYFAEIAFPLTELTRKSVTFNWEDSQQRAFVSNQS